MRFRNKVAVITGAGRGIGRATAIKFAREGASVVVNDIDKCANDVVDEIKKYGGNALSSVCDVTKRNEVRGMINSAIKEFGNIDILVNNAGITRDALIHKMKEEDWDFVINVNLKSVFYCVKEVAKYMMNNGGKIVNITSISGLTGSIGQFNYSAAKAGVIGLTKSLAKEWAKYNINVNCVAFGIVDTRLTKEKERAGTIGLPKKIREMYIESIPLKRMATTEEAANTILFLASDDASYITGTVLNVTGGLYI